MTMSVQPAGAAVYPAPVAPERKTGGGGKAVASTFIPGLGQFMDGRTGAGATFLGMKALLGLTACCLANKYGIFNKKVIIPCVIADLILSIVSAVDAYRGDRSKTQQKNFNANV